MKKIGLFGGTFNPIHIGHIRIALECLESCGLQELQFVPSALPPHKEHTGILDFNIRKKLIELTIDEYKLNSRFSVSTHEQELDGPSYTFSSVQLWKEKYNTVPYFIVGLEDFIKLETWHQGEKLPEHTNFIVVRRKSHDINTFHEYIFKMWGSKVTRYNDTIYEINGNKIEYVECTRLDISATQIRENIIHGRSIICLVPSSVSDYLLKHNIFYTTNKK